MSFTIQSVDEVSGGMRYFVYANRDKLTFDEFYNMLLKEEIGRRVFTNFLKDVPFGAYFWETAPVTLTTSSEIFQFVVLKDRTLEKTTGNESAFTNQFSGRLDDVVTFSSLGKDATLVAPTPASNQEKFPHLATFVRKAKQSQIDAVWLALANAYHQSLSTRPLWISTAGLGVPWLHIRLDSRPKYYKYEFYRHIMAP